MGYYINPKTETKEDFLRREAVKVAHTQIENWKDFDKFLPVILVDNGLFTAAGICPNENELKAWMEDRSYRPMTYFLIEPSKVTEYL